VESGELEEAELALREAKRALEITTGYVLPVLMVERSRKLDTYLTSYLII